MEHFKIDFKMANFQPTPSFLTPPDIEKMDRKGKHQMFKTLITSDVINTICITLITSAINVIWIVLRTSDVINRNYHKLT